MKTQIYLCGRLICSMDVSVELSPEAIAMCGIHGSITSVLTTDDHRLVQIVDLVQVAANGLPDQEESSRIIDPILTACIAKYSTIPEVIKYEELFELTGKTLQFANSIINHQHQAPTTLQ